jgi:hypothetical protein
MYRHVSQKADLCEEIPAGIGLLCAYQPFADNLANFVSAIFVFCHMHCEKTLIILVHVFPLSRPGRFCNTATTKGPEFSIRLATS